MTHETIGRELFFVRADKITLSDSATSRLCELAEGCEDETAEMISEASRIAVPKAIYSVASSETKNGGAFVGGVFVRSALMKKNFTGLSRVFPFVATSGKELEKWAHGFDSDPLSQYIADEINKSFLHAFITDFKNELISMYGVSGRFPSMNPGSLEKEWSIKGQDELFSMLGGRKCVEKYTGVVLTDSFLMLPSKSVSGIYFETETDYENCKLCPRDNCPNRRAPKTSKSG